MGKLQWEGEIDDVAEEGRIVGALFLNRPKEML